jgi:hypothetical protein
VLTIRPLQKVVFERDAEIRFKQKLAQHLAVFLPQKGVAFDPQEIAAQVDRGLALCPQFGLDLQTDIARCFEIVCGSAGGFTTQSLPKEALNILYAYRVDPMLKLDRLQAWADARKGPAK